MAVSNLILQTLEPKINPPTIDVVDLESVNSGSKIRDPNSTGYAQQLGRSAPIIKIGSTRIQPDTIVYMSIHMDSLIPTVHVSLIDTMGSFTSIGYPKTNPVMSIYVASGHPKLKSFAQTFLITNIQSFPIDMVAKRYDFIGELYVPNLNGNFIRSYSNMTSARALRKIAEELRLGFASNEETMNDSMTWINPNTNYKQFIKTVSDHAYKNERSFFDCFIDRYYVLNFINVEKQFRSDSEVDIGYPSHSSETLDLSRSEDITSPELFDLTIPLILTNSNIGNKYDDLKISEYSLVGENGEILNTEGFRKTAFIYKHGETAPVNKWFVEPISNLSNDLTETHQTPDLTDYTDNTVVKWMGIDYGNAHSSYKFAKLINKHNRFETEKTALHVTINSFNNNIIRGSRVRVNIYGTRTKAISDDLLKDELPSESRQFSGNPNTDNSASAEILDDQLSGFYYVKEISYQYNPRGNSNNLRFSTKMVLSRRNWKPEQKMEITPA